MPFGNFSVFIGGFHFSFFLKIYKKCFIFQNKKREERYLFVEKITVAVADRSAASGDALLRLREIVTGPARTGMADRRTTALAGRYQAMERPSVAAFEAKHGPAG